MPKFYKDTSPDQIDWGATFIPIDSQSWRQSQYISIKNLAGKIELELNAELIADRNVTSVSIDGQEKDPLMPPGLIVQRSYIAVDENYLYVWVGNRWKRTILSEW